MSVQWWEAPEGEAHSKVFEYVSEVERVQSDIFERFVRLAYLYDPYDRYAGGSYWPDRGPESNVTENIIATNVDTVAASVSATDVRVRFQTDDGDWSQQRQARHLEFYVEGLDKLLGIHEVARRAFKDAALKGGGFAKVYCDHGTGEICIERVLIDDLIVDEGECRNGKPRQLHHRLFVDRDVLKAQFPDAADEIDRAQDTGNSIGFTGRYWADYRPVERNELVAIESWRLPVGKKGKPGYQKGLHLISVDGKELYREEWTKPHFGLARMAWSERDKGWYPIGLAERIAGHQRAINKLNWQIDRQLDQMAVPTTYVRMADAALAVKTVNRAGTIVPIKADMPQTVIPPAVSPETYNRRAELKESGYEETGVSRTIANARKPSGLESGAALREWRDQSSTRMALQEKGFEQLVLDIACLVLECCAELGDDAPDVVCKSRYGKKRIKWSEVDPTDLRVSVAASSSLARTPAGRMQTVLEWAQAGVITLDESRRLMRHPDLERAMSLYTAALEDIERSIEEVLDGEVLTPEPYQNLKMGVWRFQQAYLKARGDGAPEEILEALRQWIVQAAHVLAMASAPPPAPPMPMGAGADPAAMPPGPDAAMGLPPGAPPPMPGYQEMPMGPAPVSAFDPNSLGVAPV